MNYETHIVLQKDCDAWLGVIDEDWTLDLEIDRDGHVITAVVRQNDVEWKLPCDEEGHQCRCVHLEGYTDNVEDACPWAEPELQYASNTWTGGGRMAVKDIVYAVSVGRNRPEYCVDIAKLKRPWVCATEKGPVTVYDGEEM